MFGVVLLQWNRPEPCRALLVTSFLQTSNAGLSSCAVGLRLVCILPDAASGAQRKLSVTVPTPFDAEDSSSSIRRCHPRFGVLWVYVVVSTASCCSSPGLQEWLSLFKILSTQNSSSPPAAWDRNPVLRMLAARTALALQQALP